MGQAKQMMLEQDDCNLGYIKDTYVCSRHINDYAVSNFIKSKGSKGNCFYCSDCRSIISLQDLMEFIMEGINKHYDDAADYMSYDSSEGGYLGKTIDRYDLINNLLDIDDYNLKEDITEAVSDSITWSERRQFYLDEKDLLEAQWELFKNVVKHKSRYLFSHTSIFKTEEDSQKAYDIFKRISKGIIPLGVINKIKPTTNLIRIRQHASNEKINKFNQIASTPIEYAIYPNRMSPAGISMFYCAFEYETAFKETVDVNNKKKSNVTTAIFKNKRELKIIDLSKLNHISIFDKKKRKHYFLNLFLKAFVKDLSKNIEHDGKEHIEYVPTQIVTEFFRYPFSESKKTPIDGIIYLSSKNKGKKACVLFFDAEECLKELDLIGLETRKI